MAAAAMAAASNVASQFLGQPSTNQTVANSSSGAGSSSDIPNTEKAKPVGGDAKLVTGDAEIPWRQIAGLLHGQGITDPLGLVSLSLPLSNTKNGHATSLLWRLP